MKRRIFAVRPWHAGLILRGMIIVTFAVPQESGGLRAALSQVRATGPSDHAGITGNLGARRVLLAHTGVGLAAAERTAAALLAAERPEFLVTCGFAGGLDPSLRLGDLVIAKNFSSPALLTRARSVAAAQPVRFAPLVTASEPAETASAKAALRLATGAAAVDMETAPLAAACAAAGIPLLSVRAISDTAGTPLPIPFGIWFDLKRQRPRPLPLVAYLARHPERIWRFVRFVRGLKPARAALTRFLLCFLATDGKAQSGRG